MVESEPERNARLGCQNITDNLFRVNCKATLYNTKASLRNIVTMLNILGNYHTQLAIDLTNLLKLLFFWGGTSIIT